MSDEERDEHDETGLDLARSIARGLAGRTGPQKNPRSKEWKAYRRPERPQRGTDRDPKLLDETLGKLVADHGWSTELRVHGVFSRWSSVVGDEVAQHVTPETYAEGRLVVRTDSTAWATQMKLLAGEIVRRLNEVLGDGTVQVIDVLGPHAPSWSKGRFRVKGRGPRDTYG